MRMSLAFSQSSLKNLIDRINSIINKYLNNSKIYYSVVPDKNYFVNNGNLKMNYDLLISKMNNELRENNVIVNHISISSLEEAIKYAYITDREIYGQKIKACGYDINEVTDSFLEIMGVLSKNI